MKQTITFLIASILVGSVASWYTAKEASDRSVESVKKIQADLLSVDHRVQFLLKQIQENEVELNSLQELWLEEGLGFVIYDYGKATTWTTSSIPFPSLLGRRKGITNGVIQLKNTWYLCRSTEVGDQQLAAYALIHTDLDFENQHIRNSWGPSFKDGGEERLTFSEIGTTPLVIEDAADEVYIRTGSEAGLQDSYLAPLLWLLFLILLISMLWYSANWLSSLSSNLLASVFFGVSLLLLRSLMIWAHLPKVLYGLDLFGPTLHASSAIIPSLGDLVFHLAFLLLLILRITKFHQPTEAKSRLRLWLAVLIPILLIWPVHLGFQTLIFNSSFSFDLNNPFSLDIYSVIGLVATFLILLDFLLISKYLFSFATEEQKTVRSVLVPWFFGSILLFVLLGMSMHVLPIALSGATVIAFMLLAEKWTNRMRDVSLYTPTVLVFSLFATILFSTELGHEEQESRKAIARSLSLQQNPITEYLFDELEEKISSDRQIRNAVSLVPIEQENVLQAIHDPLGYDHWNRYRAVLNLFDEKGRLLASDEERTGPNYHELQRMFEIAKPTMAKNCKYVGSWNNDGGYLARIELKRNRSQANRVVFIRLIPEQTDDILGFTDLFIDEGISNAKPLEGYSYARYLRGELQSQQGDYPYGLTDKSFLQQKTEYAFLNMDGYDHLVYRPMEHALVVVSKPNQGAIGYLTTFSYLFLFYFACTLNIILAEGRMLANLKQGKSFRSRINLAMTSVLFFSLLLIGVLTVFYVIREYNARNEEMISEKSRSVLIEMEHKLRDRQSFGEDDQAMLSALLSKFSKVFFTDINLYHLDGHLLATSRPRIFDEGLMARVMEPNAYKEMRFDQRSSFIQQETIGNLTYLTAYVPFRNEKREVVAFMSLPYFARQYGLQQEIFSLLAALTNIYVFLILISVVLALIISNRITEPLRFIRESLKNLKLDQTNRAIEWESDDEIGELVDEYNRTLNELVQSAELLARSERESAWREMAKQVAHEIKNPLTPMKLSIQMLQRSMADKAEDLEERVEKVARTLIEQIDTLSNIATEFSSFAQMPKPIVESVDLRSLLENAAHLHRNSEVDLTLNFEVDACIIQADKEQMLRVFNNLIKNGIQSVPEGRNPIIELGLIKDKQRWVASVKDNGSGIPKELEEQIFVPNFTTKSSGMGLGLAMVKNIVETANGKIWFQTETNSGTIFYVSFPAN